MLENITIAIISRLKGHTLTRFLFVLFIAVPCIASIDVDVDTDTGIVTYNNRIDIEKEVFARYEVSPLEHNGLSRSDILLAARLARGIIEIKGEAWYSCGKKLSHNQMTDLAAKISYSVVRTTNIIGSSVSVWGVIGTMYHESRFDECALGYVPRKWAYKAKMLKRSNITASHSKQSILKAISSSAAKRRFSKTGFDLGFCQILSKYYPGQEDDMLSVGRSVEMCVVEMHARSNVCNDKPWLRWRQWKSNKRYASKVRKYASKMGASAYDLLAI